MKRLSSLVAVGLVALAGCASDTSSTPGDNAGNEEESGTQLPPSAVSQIESLLTEKASWSPAQRKIASSLIYAKNDRFAEALKETKDPKNQITSLIERNERGQVLVDVKGSDAEAVSKQIESLGGTVVGVSMTHVGVRAWMDLGSLQSLADNDAVRHIRPAFMAATARADRPAVGNKFRVGTRAERIAAVQAATKAFAAGVGSERISAEPQNLIGNVNAISTGAALSQGVKAHGADRARKFFNTDGTGVRIGVLSDSDDFKEASIASGDLPADTITVPGQDGRPGGGEGTAMMEIIHDVAPGAQIFFATAFNSPESFAENIRTLRFTYHCDIIVDDIIYFFESPYQDDIIGQAVQDIADDGGLYFSSAGNEGNFDDGTSGTWEGDFRAAGTLATLPSGYTVHDFGNKVISDRIERAGGPVILHWGDPGTLDDPKSSNDYDIFVLDADLRSVAVASTDVQDGDDLPFEFVGFNIPAGFRVVIAKQPSAAVRAVRTMVFRGEYGIATSGASYGHNQADGAFGVGAVDAAKAGTGVFQAGPTTPNELFSSDGPRRVFYTRKGDPINPARPGGTFASGAGATRFKPDISAADGVSTTLPGSSGLNPFFGTSAAAPHAAAIAGLLKSAVPALTADRMRLAVNTGVIDIEGAGPDRDSGRGLSMAMDTLTRGGARPSVFLEGGTLQVLPIFSDAVLPGGSAQLNFSVINNGGASATATTAILTSANPHVFITQPFASYGTLTPEGGTANNSFPYAFVLDPATPCGEQLAFRLSVSFGGVGVSPTILGFTVATGRVDSTPTVFSFTGPAVAIPDGDDTGVNINLPVTFGRIAQATFSLDGTVCNTTSGSTTVGLNHTWVGDVSLRLTSPGGTSVTLLNAPGGPNNSANNFCKTVLSDAGATSIQNVTGAGAPYTGTFRPANPLAAMIGETGTGTWVLNAADSTFIDTGSVRAFSLAVKGFNCAPPAPPAP
jgi:subtilisin-like proprotein convertase family protein